MRPSVRVPLPLGRLLVGALLLGVAAPASAQTILNVERLQPSDVSGWHWGVEGGISLARGNTDKVDVGVGAIVGYRWPSDWLRVFGRLDYLSEDGDKVDNDRYLHVRFNHRLSERWQTFSFVQLQSRYASLLRRRFLVGGGLRRRLIDGRTTLDAGTGLMYESESLDPDEDLGDHPAEARVWRMANLVVLTRPLTESVTLIGVSYIQPRLSDFGDFRTLVDLSLRISLTENLDLTIQNVWRHDSRPPASVEADDYSLKTGFAVSFR
ncbi:MAG: DUF481 domain-containing protein [Gemmatimonadales bacterium]|jgi:putative salt-induced outer membrane protein YdiY